MRKWQAIRAVAEVAVLFAISLMFWYAAMGGVLP